MVLNLNISNNVDRKTFQVDDSKVVQDAINESNLRFGNTTFQMSGIVLDPDDDMTLTFAELMQKYGIEDADIWIFGVKRADNG